MDNQNVIILADIAFQPALVQALERAASHTTPFIKAVSDRETLERAAAGCAGQTRLIAFCTGVIVPAAVLSQCDAGAYNFHPGPPEYPGIFPSCFAINDNVPTFGATAHRMTAKVDGGEIVGVHRFDMPANIDRVTLDSLSFAAVSSLFEQLVPNLIDLSRDLTPSGEAWTGRARTRAHFEDLCQLPADISEEEFDRRYRAVGEGPEHALTFQLYGHRFKLDNLRDQDTVLRGGKTHVSNSD